MSVTIKIDGEEVSAQDGRTILQAADAAEIYIPRLCSHPDLPSSRECKSIAAVYHGGTRHDGEAGVEHEGCRLCLVEVEGQEELVRACDTPAAEGMVIVTNSERVKKERRRNLGKILTGHPHACLTCAQQEGCSRTECSTNVPVEERCCPKLGSCELQKVADFIGVPEDLPKYKPGGMPLVKDEPLFERDYNLCIGCTRCVRACRNLRGIEALGFTVKDGEVVVGPVAGTYADSGCKFCGACVEVCPTGALMDKDLKGATREEQLVPCKTECPAGIDVPAYIRFVKNGDPSSAAALVREKVPLPSVLGHVCFHPCETVCHRGEVNEPVAICALKRFAAGEDTGDWKSRLPGPGPTGKKVAIVGSGPAGLTGAYFLHLAGHEVTIFEAAPEPGGMLRYGIPAYRLPRDVLAAEIQEIKDLGITIECSKALGEELQLEELSNGYDAVLLTIGLHSSKRLDVPGVEIEGIEYGLEFLKESAAGELAQDYFAGKDVVVIGGGNVAMDAARSALRLQAKSVNLACLESQEDMPAHGWEIEDARAEGVEIHPCWGPAKFTGNGSVTGVEFICCISVFDSTGAFCPTFDNSKTKQLPADAVIIAIGQGVDPEFLEKLGLGAGPGSTVAADEKELRVRDNIFTAGESRLGPGSVVESAADGRKAAGQIDKALDGDGEWDLTLADRPPLEHFFGREENFHALPRTAMPAAAPRERRADFSLVELGLDRDCALAESKRCLQCDLRLEFGANSSPPGKWLPLTAEAVEAVPECEGVYQLANENREVIKIKGTQTLKQDLLAELENDSAKSFTFEEEPMYTKRESELLQLYMQQFGRMPGGGEDDLDDLF